MTPKDEWVKVASSSGRIYYFNERTRESRWDAPGTEQSGPYPGPPQPIDRRNYYEDRRSCNRSSLDERPDSKRPKQDYFNKHVKPEVALPKSRGSFPEVKIESQFSTKRYSEDKIVISDTAPSDYFDSIFASTSVEDEWNEENEDFSKKRVGRLESRKQNTTSIRRLAYLREQGNLEKTKPSPAAITQNTSTQSDELTKDEEMNIPPEKELTNAQKPAILSGTTAAGKEDAKTVNEGRANAAGMRRFSCNAPLSKTQNEESKFFPVKKIVNLAPEPAQAAVVDPNPRLPAPPACSLFAALDETAVICSQGHTHQIACKPVKFSIFSKKDLEHLEQIEAAKHAHAFDMTNFTKGVHPNSLDADEALKEFQTDHDRLLHYLTLVGLC